MNLLNLFTFSLLTCFAFGLAFRNAPICNPLALSARSRVFVMSDISNEPDDTMSFIRLLVHSDSYQIEGIAAVTSYWLNSSTFPDQIHETVDAYAKVVNNLQAHSSSRFPSAEYLHSIITSGPTVYGTEALKNATLSSGAQLLITKVDASADPLYIQLWGGANTLAQALQHVEQKRTSTELATFISKLRVYSISDQDDSGIYMRLRYPKLRYIASTNGWNQYGLATWTGISGDRYYSLDPGGPDTSLVSDEFIAEYFQIGPLGKLYPTPAYIMEGDSPSLLYSLPNGLGSPENPSWGSWGGRYLPVDISLRHSNHYADAIDAVVGVDNTTFTNNHATIWRWRKAYQYEMVARIAWTLSANYTSAAHPPIVSVNGSCGFEPLTLSVSPEENIWLDASASQDTDNTTLTYDWMHYREISLTQSSLIEVPRLNFTCIDSACSRVSTTMPLESYVYSSNGGYKQYHVILSATGGKQMGLTRYKRVILSFGP